MRSDFTNRFAVDLPRQWDYNFSSATCKKRVFSNPVNLKKFHIKNIFREEE